MRRRPDRPHALAYRLPGAQAYVLPVVLLGVGIAAALVAWPSAWVERDFAGTVFPRTAAVLAPLTQAVPVSLSLCLAAGLLTAAAVASASERGRRRMPLAVLWVAAVLVLSFVAVWGLAYRRQSLAELWHLPNATLGPDDVAAARSELLRVITRTAASPAPTLDDEAAASDCVASAVGSLSGTEVAVPRRVKRLPPGTLLRFGFAGVTSPWLLEPHVDAGLSPVAALATATHELTHAAGFAREADTDALAVLAGIDCPRAAVRYALALHAYAGVLAGTPPAQRRVLMDALPPRARADLQEAADVAARYRIGWLSRGAGALYDGYLRSQGVTAGLADYDGATALVLRELAQRLRVGGRAASAVAADGDG